MTDKEEKELGLPRKVLVSLSILGAMERLKQIRLESAELRDQIAPVQLRLNSLHREEEALQKYLKTVPPSGKLTEKLDQDKPAIVLLRRGYTPRKKMSMKARAAISKRMRKYWAEQRKSKKKTKKTKKR